MTKEQDTNLYSTFKKISMKTMGNIRCIVCKSKLSMYSQLCATCYTEASADLITKKNTKLLE